MVGTDFIELHNLSMEELAGVVNLYPWFATARKELCRRMARTGGWSEDQYAEMALYIGDRKQISALVRSSDTADYADKDVQRLLNELISPSEVQDEPETRKVHVVGGDYFSQQEYDRVRSEGSIFSKLTVKSEKEKVSEEEEVDVSDLFCTEALAEIYADQGYPELAKRIYSKLILVYPEKNAYFAALIEKLK